MRCGLLLGGICLSAMAGGIAWAEEESTEELTVRGSFLAKDASSATKLDLPVADTPFSVSNYTDAFLKAIEAREVADLYRYMTGIERAGDTGYDMTVRGFQTSANDRNAIMVDGLPGLSVRFGSPPTAGTDHIEVVEGPASLFYGQSEPGGFVNIVTKKPQAEQSTTIETRGTTGTGTGDALGYDVSLDSTGALDEGKTLLYRLIGQYGYDRQFRDTSFQRPIFFAPSFTWHPDDRTSLTAQFEYRHTTSSYESYLAAPNNDLAEAAPITTHYQYPTDLEKEDGFTESLQASRDLGGGATWNFGYRKVWHNDTANGFDITGFATPTTLALRARGQLNKRTYEFGDSNVAVPFDLGPINNKLVVGLDLGSETLEADRLQFYNIPTKGTGSYTLNVYDPSFANIPAHNYFPAVLASSPASLSDRYTASLAKGAYASDFLTLTDQWKLMVGVRWSREDQSIKELRLAGVAPTSDSNHATLPTAGLIYQPTKEWSLYTTYSTSFVPAPASSMDIHGNNSFTPTTAHSVEAGVKGDLLDHRLAPTFALFEIDKDNVLNTFTGGTCPASVGTCTQQVGAARSKGAQADLTMTLLPHWQLTAGYAHIDAIVTRSSIAQQVGAQLANSPEDSAHLWTRYDLAEGPLAGLGAGVGVSYAGQRASLLPTATSSVTLPLPSYTVTDLGVYYTLGNADLTFRVSNLFNDTYFITAGSQGAVNLMPGNPRTLELTLRSSF